MMLSPEEERELLEKNMPKIYRSVDNFTARRTSDIACVPYEDFVQEVSIAFIKYARRCERPEQLNIFPWYTAMGAMRDLVLTYQPMSCPKSSHRFSEIIRSMPQTVSLDVLSATTGLDIDGMSKHWVDDKETQIDFDDFMSEQPEIIKRMASMRVYGMTLKEIAGQCGMTFQSIDQKLGKLNKEYKNYTEGCAND